MQAIRDKASDVHFEPFENEYKMRYRIDGVLYEMIPPPKYIAAALSSRIKVMANLDIAERRLPQDGRISLTVQGNPVDLRVSVLPTMFGESVVLRILDRSTLSLNLDKLGFREQELKMVRQLIRRPNGIIIVTGPTGCGKTTTLYSALTELNDIESKLITTEDPIEYDLDGVIQVQMKPDIGLTFAKCLRSILRQDPDIVMVGEIRDLETAQISAQASLTGHLVFTTLAHQRRTEFDSSTSGFGGRNIFDYGDNRRNCRAATCAKNMRELPDGIHTDGGAASGTEP